MNSVIEVYTKHGRMEAANYCMKDFFIYFDNIIELESHIETAEKIVRENFPCL